MQRRGPARPGQTFIDDNLITYKQGTIGWQSSSFDTDDHLFESLPTSLHRFQPNIMYGRREGNRSGRDEWHVSLIREKANSRPAYVQWKWIAIGTAENIHMLFTFYDLLC